jgi:O-acetyl-ADP-ribose deacetylase
MTIRNRISATVGDIIEADTEAIVNAANNHYRMGAGVAGAIRSAGGPEVEREAVSRGPTDVGAAVSSTAGDLPYRRVIHAAAMGFEGGSMIPATADSVRKATTSALRIADAEGITSLAFPALGTGVGGFNIKECAEVMVGAVSEYLSRNESSGITRIVFVLRDEDAREAFQRAIL